MNRVSLAFIRVFFFVMLFISTACNKMDSSLLHDDFADAKPVVSAPQPVPDAVRLRELEGRIAKLEAELQGTESGAAAASDIPGGVTWD